MKNPLLEARGRSSWLGTEGDANSLIDKVGLSHRFDLRISKFFSYLVDSMIL